MKRFIYKPDKAGKPPLIAFFISGSGTNYQRIVEANPYVRYIVFTNRPGCEGARKAAATGHKVIELSHLGYLAGTREKYGINKVPRNCPERVEFEMHVSKLLEDACKREPDLICLAGYDQWVTDWLVEKYYPRILNVHPGDTIKGYDGLHWIPSAKAIIAGDTAVKSTLFLVDKGEDTGPVLLQSRPINIKQTLEGLEAKGKTGLVQELTSLQAFICNNSITTYREFNALATSSQKEAMKTICQRVQDELKMQGDWEIYPFAVHELIARGRVEVDGRAIYIDGKKQPETGYKIPG